MGWLMAKISNSKFRKLFSQNSEFRKPFSQNSELRKPFSQKLFASIFRKIPPPFLKYFGKCSELAPANSKAPRLKGASEFSYKKFILAIVGFWKFGFRNSEVGIQPTDSSFPNFGLRNSDFGILVCNHEKHFKY